MAIADTTIANNVRYPRDAALERVRGAKRLWAVKGIKEVRLDPATATDDDLAAAVLGPSGMLRAPALRVGDTLVVGFSPELYAEALS